MWLDGLDLPIVELFDAIFAGVLLTLRAPAGSAQQCFDLRSGGCAVIGPRIEVPHGAAQVFREFLRVEHARQPAQTDQPVDRRREVHPAEGYAG